MTYYVATTKLQAQTQAQSPSISVGKDKGEEIGSPSADIATYLAIGIIAVMFIISAIVRSIMSRNNERR